MISIIATIGKNNELSNNKKSVFNLPSDLKFFKKITINRTIIMDESTYKSGDRVLKNRYNIVVSDTLNDAPGVEIVKNVSDIVKRFKDINDDVYIISDSLYEYFVDYADKIFLTEVDESAEADSFFKEFDKSMFECKVLNEIIENNLSYRHVVYLRRKNEKR